MNKSLLFLTLMPSALWSNTLVYDPSLGTLPTAQGFNYSNPGGNNPTPYVQDGLLHIQSTEGSVYWYSNDPSWGPATSFAIEMDLRVLSTNTTYRGNNWTVGGWYVYGFSSVDGYLDFSISTNALNMNNTPTTTVSYPYTVDTAMHHYLFQMNQQVANVFIDGNLVISNFLLPNAWTSTPGILFGPGAYESVGVSELAYFCAATNATSCAPTNGNVPEPGTALMLGLGLVSVVAFGKHGKRINQ